MYLLCNRVGTERPKKLDSLTDYATLDVSKRYSYKKYLLEVIRVYLFCIVYNTQKRLFNKVTITRKITYFFGELLWYKLNN